MRERDTIALAINFIGSFRLPRGKSNPLPIPIREGDARCRFVDYTSAPDTEDP